MRSSLQSKLYIFDIVKLTTLLAPVVVYFLGIGPKISELRTTTSTLNLSLSVTSTISRINQNLTSVIESLEMAPSEYGLRDLNELSFKAFSELKKFDAQAIKDPILDHLIQKYVESETRRLDVQKRLGQAFFKGENGASWALKNQLRLLNESHISKMSDLSEYLSLSLKFISNEIEVQRDLILLFGLFSILIVGSTMILKNRYLMKRVIDPIKKVVKAQNELKNDRFPGPVSIDKNLDLEVFEILDSFNRMEKGLKESRNFLTVVSAATAHDLKEPLSAIVSLHHIWQLKKGNNPSVEELENLWRRALLNCFSGLQLVDDILQFSRSSLGKTKVESSCVASIAKASLAECIKWSDPELVFNLHIGTIRPVYADKKQLAMIFRNLIMNTIKHNPASKVLNAKIEEINAAESLEQNKVRIRYIDHKIADKNHQSVQSLFQKGAPNSGMGLMICEKIIEKMGGTFEAHRNSDNEFELIIDLPLAPL